MKPDITNMPLPEIDKLFREGRLGLRISPDERLVFRREKQVVCEGGNRCGKTFAAQELVRRFAPLRPSRWTRFKSWLCSRVKACKC